MRYVIDDMENKVEDKMGRTVKRVGGKKNFPQLPLVQMQSIVEGLIDENYFLNASAEFTANLPLATEFNDKLEPKFRTNITALAHYNNHKELDCCGRVMTIIKYFKLIEQSIEEAKGTAKWNDPLVKHLYTDMSGDEFSGHKFMVVVREEDNKRILASAYWAKNQMCPV